MEHKMLSEALKLKKEKDKKPKVKVVISGKKNSVTLEPEVKTTGPFAQVQ